MKNVAFSLILFLIALSSNAQDYLYSDYSEEYSVEATFVKGEKDIDYDGNPYWILTFADNTGETVEVENYSTVFLINLISSDVPINIGKKFIVTVVDAIDYYDDYTAEEYYYGVSCTFPE